MGQDTYFCQRLNYAHYFGIRPSPSLTFIVLCPFFCIASTFPFVLLYTWIHIVWSPSHLSAPSCVSTCVAYIEDMMLLQFCTCVMTAFFKTQFEGRSHTSNRPQHFSLITFCEYQCCSSPRSDRYCITYIVNVIVRDNGNGNMKK